MTQFEYKTVIVYVGEYCNITELDILGREDYELVLSFPIYEIKYEGTGNGKTEVTTKGEQLIFKREKQDVI